LDLREADQHRRIGSHTVSRVKRPGRPTGSVGEATRLKIISVTMKHIGENGYAKATLGRIADEAGVTSGAVYYYFKSKKALVVAVIADVNAQLLDRFERAAGKAVTLRGKLTAILEETIAITDEMPDLAKFSVSVRVDGPRYPELRRALAHSSGSYYKLYRRIIEEGIDAGEVVPGIDPQDLTDMFSIISFGLTMLTVELPGDRHRVAIRTIERLLAGSLFPSAIPGQDEGALQGEETLAEPLAVSPPSRAARPVGAGHPAAAG
jgi:AcrR family transcriptional regulator